jgi:hypothetical protein
MIEYATRRAPNVFDAPHFFYPLLRSTPLAAIKDRTDTFLAPTITQEFGGVMNYRHALIALALGAVALSAASAQQAPAQQAPAQQAPAQQAGAPAAKADSVHKKAGAKKGAKHKKAGAKKDSTKAAAKKG